MLSASALTGALLLLLFAAAISTIVAYRYLGLYDTEIEAAIAYDKAAVKQKGLQAITNFDLANYLDELNPGKVDISRKQ